jgi:hypothetical protein
VEKPGHNYQSEEPNNTDAISFKNCFKNYQNDHTYWQIGKLYFE